MQHRHVLQLRRVADLPARRGLDRDDRLDLVGPLLGDLEAERAALAVQQHHAGTDLVDQRDDRPR